MGTRAMGTRHEAGGYREASTADTAHGSQIRSFNSQKRKGPWSRSSKLPSSRKSSRERVRSACSHSRINPCMPRTPAASPNAATKIISGIRLAAVRYTLAVNVLEYTPTSASSGICGATQQQKQKKAAKLDSFPRFLSVHLRSAAGSTEFWISAQSLSVVFLTSELFHPVSRGREEISCTMTAFCSAAAPTGDSLASLECSLPMADRDIVPTRDLVLED